MIHFRQEDSLFMNPIVKLCASALPGEKKYVLFAGAGISKDAGIPTAWDLMLEIAKLLYVHENEGSLNKKDLEKWFLDSKYSKLSFSELMKEFYPQSPEQQDFLKKYLSTKNDKFAHDQIAELARRGIIRAIITTNFDCFIEEALIGKGIEIQTISTDDDLNNSEPLIQCKYLRIYKPHGTLGKGALRNTPFDINSLSPLMEEELVRVVSEHGLLVIGYSGKDPGIMKILDKRKKHLYQVFWVDPNRPSEEANAFLSKCESTYLPCKNASSFFSDFFKIQDRLKEFVPTSSNQPNIFDLKQALETNSPSVGPLFTEFFQGIVTEIEKTRPDFSKYTQPDEAILQQIEEAIPIIAGFSEACCLASKFENKIAVESLYEHFGSIYKLYDVPEGFNGSFNGMHFDGFRFLGYEMMVVLASILIKFSKWSILKAILSSEILIEGIYKNGYIGFPRLSCYLRSIEEYRNDRLNLQRTSIFADIIKERWEKNELSSFLTHFEFMSGDYFLFLKSLCYEDNLERLSNTWCPRSNVWLQKPPRFILMLESKKQLRTISDTCGFNDDAKFIDLFTHRCSAFVRYWPAAFLANPIEYFDFSKIGTKP
jgi:NAD-dependent protein deacetylases, SIR2 family